MKTLSTKTNNTSIWMLVMVFFITSHVFSQQYCFNVQAKSGNSANLNDNQDTTFEVFKSTTSGVGCLTATSAGNNELRITNGQISGNIDNVLIRESKRDNPNRNDRLAYDISFSDNPNRDSNNLYHGAYGWWRNGNVNNNSFVGGARNGVVEWYVVQGYHRKQHATFGMRKIENFSYQDAGGTYDVYIKDISNQGSVYTNVVNFTQVKCVRRSSVSNSSSRRTLNMSVHFNNMLAATNLSRIDNLFEISYCVEGFGGFNGSAVSAFFNLDARFSSGSNNSGGGGGGTNWPEISPGKYVWSSGTYNGNEGAYSANYANDNNFNSRWASNRTSNGQYYAYDLYAHYYINKITLHFDTAYAYNVNVYASNGGNWTLIRQNFPINYYSQEIPIETTARWIYIASNGGPYDHISLKEFDVFGNYQYGKRQSGKGQILPITSSALASTDFSERSLKVYPNPVVDNFNIKLEGIEKATVTITDLLGKTVYQNTTDSGSLELNKGNMFKSGMYIISARDEFDKVYTSKLIIK